jgi:NAD(P)-dependent dehydrogenase (short-subunit alcohol dehydrogenase family)
MNLNNSVINWGPFDLSGAGIGVTGAGGHLGREITRMLLASGATVVVVGRNAKSLNDLAEECTEYRGKIIVCPGDIADPAVICTALDLLDNSGSTISGWVNNAYSSPGGSPGLNFERDEIKNGLLELENTMMVTKWVSERMSAGRGLKSIVNIASMYGVVSPNPEIYEGNSKLHNPAIYGVIKSALIQFTKYSAVHLAEKNIRVNSISPGPFPSAKTQENSEFIRLIEQKVPMKRIGESIELAGLVTFLLGNAASFITGENIMVDGGWTAW